MNITKEGALIATRNKRDVVVYKDITEALERIDLGIAHPLSMSQTERKIRRITKRVICWSSTRFIPPTMCLRHRLSIGGAL